MNRRSSRLWTHIRQAIFAEAAGQWLALAEDGYAPAQRALGSLYERGQGVEKNTANAFEWTKKAAEQNDPVAMFNLACYHDKGFGVKKNQQIALTWYRKAAEYGHPEAAALIASLIETGDRGLEKDMDEAVRWYQIAANRGNVLAMGRLAWLYSTGTGVPQDAAFAFQYFLKAAQGGNAACMMNTAILYARGEGTPHNAHEALYWAEQAKKHGAPQAEQLHQCHQEERIRSKTGVFTSVFLFFAGQIKRYSSFFCIMQGQGGIFMQNWHDNVLRLIAEIDRCIRAREGETLTLAAFSEGCLTVRSRRFRTNSTR